MNRQKLKKAEQRFLELFPGGFAHPTMKKLGLKHRPEKMTSLAEEAFMQENFQDSAEIVVKMAQLVTRSSMISLFEKPKFKEFALSLSSRDKDILSQGLMNFLYQDEARGFEKMLEVLDLYKLAKWSIITICPFYFRPTKEVFVKPNTTKGIIDYFEIKEIQYHPRPTYQFYQAYRSIINQMKQEVDPSLSPGNAEFCGFLMMAMYNFRLIR